MSSVMVTVLTGTEMELELSENSLREAKPRPRVRTQPAEPAVHTKACISVCSPTLGELNTTR